MLERFVRASVRQLQHFRPTDASAAVDESGILEHFEVGCVARTRRGVAPARFRRSRPALSHGRRARAQFDADTSTMLNDPLARSVAQFLQKREPHRSADGGGARAAASDSRTPRRSRADASGRGALERPSRGRPLWLPRLGRDGIGAS